MDDFFARSAVARWPKQARFHWYFLPPDHFRKVVKRYQHALGDDTIGQFGLGLQLLEHLHFTVQMTHLYGDEVQESLPGELVTDLAGRLATVAPFELRVGPPQAGQHAVEFWIEPSDETGEHPQWRALVEHARESVAGIAGSEALPPLGPNATPHCSLGYGTGPGDSGAITSSLKCVRHPLVPIVVNEVHLLAVYQRPDEGRFDWEVLGTVALGG